MARALITRSSSAGRTNVDAKLDCVIASRHIRRISELNHLCFRTRSILASIKVSLELNSYKLWKLTQDLTRSHMLKGGSIVFKNRSQHQSIASRLRQLLLDSNL